MRRFKQLSRADRLKLEALLKAGHGKQEIADQIGVHVSTIYREIKRGTYTHTNSDLTEEDIQRVEDWINDYPREMFGWKTSGELFQEELARLA